MPKTKVVICPYCGETQPAGERCRSCRGLFEPLSRQATHNAMGPWWIRSPERPHQPGCSYETLIRLIERGQVTKYSVLRGPTTKQFWTVARHVPGVAHLLGYCHACDAEVNPLDHGCPACGVPFGAYLDRNYLGLPEVRPLPGEAPDGAHMTDDRSGLRADGGATSLSAFVADEELLSRGDRGEANGRFGSAAIAAAEPRSDPKEDGEAASRADADRLLTSPAVRAMQRRLAAQQRTIRVLTVMVIFFAVVGAMFNVITVMRSGGKTVETSPETSVDQSLGDVGSESAQPEASEPEPKVVEEAPKGTDGAVTLEEPEVAGPDSPPAADMQAPADLVQEAQRLLDQARDASVDRAVRIEGLREAQRLLETIPESDRTAAVTALHEEIREELDRMEIESLLP